MSNPLPGWYDDPGSPGSPGSGQRFWDGSRWTDQHRHPAALRAGRPNRHALLLAALFGAVAWAGLLVVFIPRLDRDPAFLVGSLLVPAAAATFLVGLVARGSSRRLGWWVYAGVVPIAAVLGVLLNVDVLTTSTAEASSRGAEVGVMSRPPAVQGWSILETPETRADVSRVVDGLRSRTGTDAVAGYYLHEGAPDTPVLFIGVNGDLDTHVSGSRALSSFLAGASVTTPRSFDPGFTGGVMACGHASAQGTTWTSCGWVGDQHSALVRWNDDSVSLDQAAALTRQLRDLSLG